MGFRIYLFNPKSKCKTPIVCRQEMALFSKREALLNMKESKNRTGRLLQTVSFLLIFGASLSAAYGQAVKSIPVFDGRDDSESVPPAVGEYDLIKKEVRKNESIIRETTGITCEEDDFSSLDISGMTNGSFTKPNAQQKAYLYELCRSGRAFGIGGIVVVENSRIVAHYVYGENGLDSDIAALPDINQNGFSEIMLIGGGTGQGYTQNAVEIIELTPGGVNAFGIADTYEDNFGTEDAKKSATAYKISVLSGKTPVFFREAYTRKSESGKWLLKGKSQKFALRRDYEPKFHKIS